MEAEFKFKATESFQNILAHLPIKEVETEMMGIIKRLMNGDWYTSKIPAIEMIPTCYPHVSPSNQQELLT
jgi:hypothetical protein